MRKRTNITSVILIGLWLIAVGSGFCATPTAAAAKEATPSRPSAAAAVHGEEMPAPAAAIPATSYFPILPLGADTDVQPQWLPVASNHALDGNHTGLNHAIIIIHDQSRDANSALALLTALAGSANATTILIAPQFLLDADIERFADHLPNGGKMFARWPLAAGGSWDDGGDSMATASLKGISSFTALDLLLIFLSDRQFFPDMQDVAIVGHGSGGDFVQRYAAIGQAPDILDRQHMPVRFVTANATSFLYFTSSRPKPLQNTDKKALPKHEPSGIGVLDSTQCPNYNVYKYGLDQLNPYARRVGGNAIKLRYSTRSVSYLTGEGTQQVDQYPDMSCGAQMQGIDRVRRAMNYNMYLNIIFSGDIAKRQKFVVVPKVGYDPPAIFGSPCGMALLFGDGECP